MRQKVRIDSSDTVCSKEWSVVATFWSISRSAIAHDVDVASCLAFYGHTRLVYNLVYNIYSPVYMFQTGLITLNQISETFTREHLIRVNVLIAHYYKHNPGYKLS